MNLHVQKNKMTCEDILDYSLYLLKKEGYSFDEDFEKALKENIVTVYPRENTLKKEEEFVFDTILGIKRIMRSTGVDTKILKVKDIPPYSKNDDTLSEEPVELIPPNYEIKNIMVLALSTLTNKKKSSFEYREGEEILFSDSDCKYQLEPITKYFIETHKGESINIIELCTDEVINSKDDEGDTAKLFFENRIQEYNNKKGYNCELNFIQVEIDENNTDKGLVKAVNTLIDIKKNNKVNHIWIDTHGGFRDVTFTLNSLISLLKIYDVNPNRIFGVRFSGPGDKSINQIVDQENSFKMSNFVSGMNEFIKYGSAELLADYYSSEDDLQTNKIVKAIREVSDGTKLCDPGMYLKSLDNLGQSINEYNEIEKPFDVFVRYIKDDYGLLLDNSRRRNIDVIERCYKKGMYQQALTFIESLMPDDYVNKGFVSCDSGQRSNIQASKETQRKTYVSDEYYIFDTFISLKINYYTRDRADSIKTDKGFTDNEMKDYGSLQMIKYFSGENVDYTFNGQNPMPENNSQRRHNTRDFNIIVNNRNKNRDDLFNLFRLHYAIKQIRNITNHSKTNMFRPTLEEISKALNKYIELAKIVLE